MDRSAALSMIEREVGRIAELAADPGVDRAAVVPTCPGWTLDHLLDHLGRVYAMVATVLGDDGGKAPDRQLIPRRPEGQDPLDWMRERLDLVLPALGEVPGEALRWNFVGGPQSPVSFWWRRQAHETLIHRVDAELAARAEVGAVAPEVAADGVAEHLLVCGLSEAPGDELAGGPLPTVHLHATDVPEGEWTIDAPGRRFARAHVRAAAALRAHAWSLHRWAWGRGSAVPGGAEAGLFLADAEAFGDIGGAEQSRPTR